jgi:hypothetical protein
METEPSSHYTFKNPSHYYLATQARLQKNQTREFLFSTLSLNSKNEVTTWDFVAEFDHDKRDYYFFFIILSCVRLSPLGTAAATGLFYQPQMIIVIVEQLVERRLAGETEVLGGNLPQSQFVHHKSHTIRPGLETGPPLWETSDYPPELIRYTKYYFDFRT